MSQENQDIGPPSLHNSDFGKIPFLSLSILFFKGFKVEMITELIWLIFQLKKKGIKNRDGKLVEDSLSDIQYDIFYYNLLLLSTTDCMSKERFVLW